MAVTWGAAAAVSGSESFTGPTTSGSDVVGYAAIIYRSNGGTLIPTAVTWGGAAMTLVHQQDDAFTGAQLWRRIAPSSGGTVAITRGATAEILTSAFYVNGNHQTTPASGATGVHDYGGTSITRTVTSQTNALVIGLFGFKRPSRATVTLGGGQTERANEQTGTASSDVQLVLSTEAGGTSVVTDATFANASGDDNVELAVSLDPVGGGTATQIAVNAGNNQSAVVNTAVPVLPSVLVRDASDNPVSGVSVTFAVATGGGAITGGSPTTNGSGIATVGSWTLGTTAGTNTLTATSSGLTGSPVTFTATGTAGAATTIAKNAGDAQTAAVSTTVATAPSARITDTFGNVVAGTSVTFAVASGGGSATGTAATSSASGIATVGSWTLGSAPGANTLTATSAGLTGSPQTFTATGTASLGVFGYRRRR